MSSRLYVGVTSEQKREIFRSKKTPIQENHPEFVYVIGPFRTKAGAIFMRDYGKNNPHCQCVSDAESCAKRTSS